MQTMLLRTHGRDHVLHYLARLFRDLPTATVYRPVRPTDVVEQIRAVLGSQRERAGSTAHAYLGPGQ